jgi:negative regulator of flagellin synthesis FlgM
MHIYSKHTGPVSSDVAQSAQPVDAADRIAVSGVVPTPSTTDRSDKVQISDAGRALAARGGDRVSSDLDPARSASVRQRILSGAYDTVEVVDAVARRLLASGDL